MFITLPAYAACWLVTSCRIVLLLDMAASNPLAFVIQIIADPPRIIEWAKKVDLPVVFGQLKERERLVRRKEDNLLHGGVGFAPGLWSHALVDEFSPATLNSLTDSFEGSIRDHGALLVFYKGKLVSGVSVGLRGICPLIILVLSPKVEIQIHFGSLHHASHCHRLL